MKITLKLTTTTCLLLAVTSSARAMDVSAEDLMQRLEGVAPVAVLANATLLHVPEEGEPEVLREGTNGWTCMYPGGDPMCLDSAAMAWAQAWMSKTEPPATVGFAYMMLGDEGASNIDPFAMAESADNQWIETGPHVMIVGSDAKEMLATYPHEVPEGAGAPWVMWPGTPYAHVMLPVK